MNGHKGVGNYTISEMSRCAGRYDVACHGGANVIRVLPRMNAAIKVVAASDFAANGNRSEAPGPSIKQFLTKPYTAEILLTTIRTILDED